MRIRYENTTSAGTVAAWSAHPGTVLAALLLVVNDHLLKRAAPGLITGKLSDGAGLLVAPPLLALALAPLVARRHADRLAAAALTLTGLGFTLVKCTATGAALASQAWSVVGGPSTVLRDPTDLAALPGLGLAWWLWTRARARRPQWRTVRITVLLPLMVLTVCASGEDGSWQAAQVGTADGTLLVSTDSWLYRSTDGGLNWEGQDRTPPAGGTGWQPPAPLPFTPQRTACVPGAPAHCFRATGAPRVEETTDGGTHWNAAWQLSPGRALFQRRDDFFDEDPAGAQPATSVAVVPRAGGYAVLVAMDRDGLLVRDPAGRWQRQGWAGLDGDFAGQAPLTGFLSDINSELGLALAVGTACTVLGYAMAIRRRLAVVVVRLAAASGWILLILLARDGAGDPAPGTGLPIIVLGLPSVLAVVLATVGPERLTLGEHWSLLGVGALSTLGVALPFIGWSVAAPDSYRTAALLAGAAGLLGTAGAVLAGRTVLRRSGRRPPVPTT
ncbi:hypothetical protein OG455_06550 [Kitasatospora sp. NBC_01287]|uniref:hypothetical protein n=1 Tax=Kitasatospora sp. NBC_01287 TaxID=2903573 RepID=UPI0022599898|nr:hypothetical protein [Kitasatospora sp. NBC_01287]MCX4745182.1 hypothetical protein [Kitasatospora sp. NBC_01287]